MPYLRDVRVADLFSKVALDTSASMGLFARKFSPSPDLPEVLPGLARLLFPASSPIVETYLGTFRPSSEEMFTAEREENAQPT